MRAALLILALVLAGCGQPWEPGVHPAPGGVYVDATTYDELAQDVAEVEACLGLEPGAVRLDDLAVVFMPGPFPCPEFPNGACMGEFTPPNLVKISLDLRVFKHELIHHILWQREGDMDAAHRDPAFWDCT